jgi:hypothetical protein
LDVTLSAIDAMNYKQVYSRVCVGFLLLRCTAASAAEKQPGKLLADDTLLATPLQLSMVDGKHSFVFRGEAGKSGFNLHSYIAHFDGLFWAMWSSAASGEKDPDQFIRYATSRDGHSWSEAKTLVADPDGPQGAQRWIARGLFASDGKLNALGGLVGDSDYRQRGRGVVWADLKLMQFTWSGGQWKPAGLFADDCMSNFPAIRVAGKLLMPCRDKNMSVYVAVRDAHSSRWRRIPIEQQPPFHRMDEPTIYVAADRSVHLIIRDGTRSGKLIRSISQDEGKSWSTPVLTNYPDATSKNFAAQLSDGTFYLINNPNPKKRDPLAISFSRDGWEFDRPWLLRKDAPRLRAPGRAKGSGSY